MQLDVIQAQILTMFVRKEGKRVSNALYGLCKMFLESHAQGIQMLTNQSTRFKWPIVGMVSSAS